MKIHRGCLIFWWALFNRQFIQKRLSAQLKFKLKSFWSFLRMCARLEHFINEILKKYALNGKLLLIFNSDV